MKAESHPKPRPSRRVTAVALAALIAALLFTASSAVADAAQQSSTPTLGSVGMLGLYPSKTVKAASKLRTLTTKLTEERA